MANGGEHDGHREHHGIVRRKLEKRIFCLNLNFFDFIILETTATDTENVFLVDTESEISILKEKCISDLSEINSDEII